MSREHPVTYVGAVYPWQCDQVGHLNVTYYMQKYDEATWNFFASIGMDGAYFRSKKGGMGAVDMSLTYARELYPGDVVEIRTSVVEVKPKAITFHHVMVDRVTKDEVSTCTITAVHIDPRTRKGSPLPDDVFGAAVSLSRSA